MADVSVTLLVLKTRQVEQLRLFYQTLGIGFAEEQHGKGPVHFADRAGDVLIEVYPLRDDGSPVDSSTRLGFAVGNVAEVIRCSKGSGPRLSCCPRRRPGDFGGVVRDPDGRSVELTQK